MTDSPARGLLDHLLAECKRQDASDIHLAPDLPPYLRVHGVLEALPLQPNSPADMAAIADILAADRDRSPLDRIGSLDGAVNAPDGTRYRFNVFRRGGHLAIALRRLEDRFRSLAELGLPDALYQLCDLPDGLVVVSGPTGSGKSTTLATLLDRINRSRRCHIVTIEDPVEYVHKTALALVNQRQIGSDTPSFNDALVASLRQDPDVILVGEVRDQATIRTAITAAETGHLVFTTVHAGDCAGTIERMISVFPAEEQPGMRRQLSLVLRAILSQHLLVADGPSGRTPSNPTRRSRCVVSEVLTITPAAANLIATGKSAQLYSAMEAGGSVGMQTLEQDLARLLRAGLITEATAVLAARNPGVLRDRMAMMRKPTGAGGRSGTGGGAS